MITIVCSALAAGAGAAACGVAVLAAGGGGAIGGGTNAGAGTVVEVVVVLELEGVATVGPPLDSPGAGPEDSRRYAPPPRPASGISASARAARRERNAHRWFPATAVPLVPGSHVASVGAEPDAMVPTGSGRCQPV
jgi:hypothetical protein